MSAIEQQPDETNISFKIKGYDAAGKTVFVPGAIRDEMLTFGYDDSVVVEIDKEWLAFLDSISLEKEIFGCGISRLPSLTRLPSRLFELTSFQCLAIHKCYALAELPPDIGLLVNLRDLRLKIVGIRKLPAELAKCTKLSDLALGGMTLEYLPPLPACQPLNLLFEGGLDIGRNAMSDQFCTNFRFFGLENVSSMAHTDADLFGSKLGLPYHSKAKAAGVLQTLFSILHRSPVRDPALPACYFSQKARWYHIYQPFLITLCIGLQELKLPTLVLYTIFRASHHWLARGGTDRKMPMVWAWDTIVRVRHRK